MRVYSNPTMQELVTGMYANVESAQRTIDAMKATVNQQRRKEDRVTEITAEQEARIEANRGKHVYGSSHPKFAASV